jgi:hypothetical protein
MKKFSWIIAMFAVLALLFVGCPGNGNGNGDDEEDGEFSWFLALDDDGTKAPNNTITIDVEDNVRVFVSPTGNFSRIKMDFTCEPAANIMWHAVRTGASMEESTLWGGSDYIDFTDGSEGPYDVALSVFNTKWHGDATTLVPADVFMFTVYVGDEDGPGTHVFTLKNVELLP